MNQLLDTTSELPALLEWAKTQGTSVLGKYLKSDIEWELVTIHY